jgi:3-oxosteroid 1-dehydrogenase
VSDNRFDLVVIGSGAGGLTAVITAKLAGLRPLLLEKTPLIGGSSALSGGILWLPNNPLMAREGIPDSRAAALQYLANFVPENPIWSSPRRREVFVDTVAPVVSMLEEQGMKFARCDGYSDYYDLLPGGHARGRSLEAPPYNANRLGAWRERFRGGSMPFPIRTSEGASMLTVGVTWKGKRTAARVAARTIMGKLAGRTLYGAGGALQGRLLEIALRLGIDIWTDAGLTGFDLSAGRVTGVHVNHEGRHQTVTASRGVLVSAGGFARNLKMRERYQRHPVSDTWTSANPGETGEALQAMIDLGAGTAVMDEAWWNMSWIREGHPPTAIVAELPKPHSILVDHGGNRFVNEANSYMEVGSTCYERHKVSPAVPAWFVMDSRFRRRYIFGLAPPGRRVPDEWVDKGWVQLDDTIEGLARKCGIDPVGLAATVKRFNGFCETGKDLDFGRGDSVYNHYYADPTVKPNPSLGAIAEPPFWAVALYPGDVGTCGGVMTNEDAQVLREDGSIIDGLYAAGNCAAPIAGSHYVGAGQSIGTSSIFGYVAAKHVAAS